MPERMNYRRQLLRAVEAFLEGTPSAQRRAQRLIDRCYTAINSEEKKMTLDEIVWSFLIVALTDSVFYESEEFLRETRALLLGQTSQSMVRAVFSDDYRVYFTAHEMEWYTQLVSLGDFLAMVPYAKIHEATSGALQKKENWTTILATIPEVALAKKIEEEYMQRKTMIENLSARSPLPENIGDEKIYHYVLCQVTSLLTAINMGLSTKYCGYPVLGGNHSTYAAFLNNNPNTYPDITECIRWAKRLLERLAGKGTLVLTCSLSKAPTFNADVLCISLS